MVQVRIKRVYEDFSETDGYRVLVDKLWPRGIKKEWLKYDYWAKDITPSAALRRWFHEDIPGHWGDFVFQTGSGNQVVHPVEKTKESRFTTSRRSDKGNYRSRAWQGRRTAGRWC